MCSTVKNGALCCRVLIAFEGIFSNVWRAIVARKISGIKPPRRLPTQICRNAEKVKAERKQKIAVYSFNNYYQGAFERDT